MMWDTTTTKERQLIFGMPAGKADIPFKLKSLVDHSWAAAAVGLHRPDTARRAVGILCYTNLSKSGKNDDHYLVVINAADMCAHASEKTKIPWKMWKRSTTVIQIASSAMKTISMSGCWLFAVVKGLSGWNFLELLRIYDFSAGARSGRYPNRPLVRDVLLNLGRGTVDQGNKVWCFSDDNLLLFHVSPPSPLFASFEC